MFLEQTLVFGISISSVKDPCFILKLSVECYMGVASFWTGYNYKRELQLHSSRMHTRHLGNCAIAPKRRHMFD